MSDRPTPPAPISLPDLNDELATLGQRCAATLASQRQTAGSQAERLILNQALYQSMQIQQMIHDQQERERRAHE